MNGVPPSCVQVPKILVQFNASSINVLPPNIGQIRIGQDRDGSDKGQGIKVIAETKNCDISGLPEFLKDYYLDLNYVRVARKTRRDDFSYLVVSFTFSTEKNPTITQELDQIYPEFCQLCENNLWQLRLFNNPLPQGDRGLALGFCMRRPLTYPNGKPVIVYEKDERGKKIEGTGARICPENVLEIADDCFTVRSLNS